MYTYGNPATGAVDNRPRCWGQSFNSEDPECRRCAFQASCRDQVIRMNVNRQVQVPQAPAPVSPTQQYFQNFQQPVYNPQPYLPSAPVAQQATVPVVQAPQPPPQPVRVQAPIPPRPMTPVAPQQPAPIFGANDWYGRVQDPMMYHIGAAPPPYRPQMEGESFFERVSKNVGLAMMEGFFGQLFLAVRQMVLPPAPRPVAQQDRSQVVDSGASKSAP
jgi:hypothetical protein